jgi:predicted MPP superfamily phosphohydrolase
MTVLSSLIELRARLQLQGSETLVLAVAEDDARVDATRDVVAAFLRAEAMALVDLGACASDEGPVRWVEDMQPAPPGAVGILTFVPATSLAGGAFARRLNAEREWLRRLAAPVVLVVSRAMELVLRRNAPDFFTWIARSYDLSPFDELAPLAGREPEAGASAAEPPIRFLHLSDLHLRPQRIRRYDQDHVLRGLLEFLERDRAAFPLDLIFITGDLAFGGKPEEYALVRELLARLADATGVPAARTFVVPGNHDVDREVGRWLLRTLPSREAAAAFFVEPEARRFHAEKVAAYQRALGPALGPARPLGLAVGAEAVEQVEIRGVRIAVASFNSAWFAQGDDDREKLWIGGPTVEQASDAIAAGEAQFAVALLHHPLDQLHELDREDVEPWFDRSFDLVLRGHLHRNRTQSIATQRGGHVEVAAPAAYQGSPWQNGCFLGEIRAAARTVRLRPYTYAAGPDPWVIDPKVFPDDSADGHCRTFTVPEKRRARGAAASPRRRTRCATRRRSRSRRSPGGSRRGRRRRASSRPSRRSARSPTRPSCGATSSGAPRSSGSTARSVTS